MGKVTRETKQGSRDTTARSGRTTKLQSAAGKKQSAKKKTTRTQSSSTDHVSSRTRTRAAASTSAAKVTANVSVTHKRVPSHKLPPGPPQFPSSPSTNCEDEYSSDDSMFVPIPRQSSTNKNKRKPAPEEEEEEDVLEEPPKQVATSTPAPAAAMEKISLHKVLGEMKFEKLLIGATSSSNDQSQENAKQQAPAEETESRETVKAKKKVSFSTEPPSVREVNSLVETPSRCENLQTSMEDQGVATSAAGADSFRPAPTTRPKISLRQLYGEEKFKKLQSMDASSSSDWSDSEDEAPASEAGAQKAEQEEATAPPAIPTGKVDSTTVIPQTMDAGVGEHMEATTENQPVTRETALNWKERFTLLKQMGEAKFLMLAPEKKDDDATASDWTRGTPTHLNNDTMVVVKILPNAALSDESHTPSLSKNENNSSNESLFKKVGVMKIIKKKDRKNTGTPSSSSSSHANAAQSTAEPEPIPEPALKEEKSSLRSLLREKVRSFTSSPPALSDDKEKEKASTSGAQTKTLCESQQADTVAVTNVVSLGGKKTVTLPKGYGFRSKSMKK